jgi:hypothetical protein
MERITGEQLETRVANVNRRMEQRGSIYRYEAQGRNGYIGLDRVRPRESGDTIESTVTCGTKREVADFLHAMMVALDDASFTS